MKLIRYLPILIGLMMLVCGLVLMCFPPKEINGVYGYRTTRSYSSQKCWDYAQKYSARVMVLSSACLLVICGVVCCVEHCLNASDFSAVIVNSILVVMMSFIVIALVICLTERALAKM